MNKKKARPTRPATPHRPGAEMAGKRATVGRDMRVSGPCLKTGLNQGHGQTEGRMHVIESAHVSTNGQ